MTKTRVSLSSVGFGIIVVITCFMVFLGSSLQNVAAQSSALLNNADLDITEAIEAGNVTKANQILSGNMSEIEFLFIQRAQSGSLSEINATAYILELENVSDSTIMFADRPNRIVTSISTSDFVGNWTAGSDSFAVDAPNDALIVEDIQTGELETAIIESFNPVYDTNTNTLTYTIVAENGTSMNMPNQFGESILVIDFRGCLDGDWSSGCETGPD